MKTTACILLLAAATWAQEVAVPQGGSLGPSCKLSDAATLGADKVDGSHGSATPAANTVPVADSNGKLAPGWIPLPTGSSIGGIFMSADCVAGNHVNGIDPVSGQLKCTGDAADWSNVGNKPSAFPPDTGSQAWQDLLAALALKAASANAALTGTTTAEQIVAATSVQVGSGTPAVNFSFGTAAPTGACTAGVYYRQVSADTTAKFMCTSGAWAEETTATNQLADPGSPGVLKRTTANTTAVAGYADIVAMWTSCTDGYLKYDGTCSAVGGGTSSEATPALSEPSSGGDSGKVVSTKPLKATGGIEDVSDTDQSLTLASATSPAVSASGYAKLSVQSNKLMVSENSAAYVEVAKLPSGKTQMFTDTVATASQLPKPTAAALGGVYSDADCASGQHFNGIDTSTGKLKCSADVGSGLSGMTTGAIQKAASATTLASSALSEDSTNVNSSKPIVVSGTTAITGADGSAPSAPAAGSTILYTETTNGWATINSGGTKKYMVNATACAGATFVKGYNADGTASCSTPSGTGDVSGGASSADHNLAQYNGTTGKTIEDSGVAAGNVVTAASNFANGGLVKAAGANKTLASADLSGDVTTSGGVVASLAAPFKKRACEIVITGTDTANALKSGDDTPANNSCYNKLGVTETIVGVYCKTDGAGTGMTVNPTFGSNGTGTTILSGALTCGSSEAYSATGTVSNGALTDGSGIRPVMGGTLTGTNLHVLIVYTVPAS